MKLNKISYLSIAAVAAMFVSCAGNEPPFDAPGRAVQMSVDISRNQAGTRATLTETDGDLSIAWEQDDNILVTDVAGAKLGVLSLTSGAGTETARFEGVIKTELSGDANLNLLYLGRKSAAELATLPSPVSVDFSSQEGTLESLSYNDFFSTTVNATIDGSVTVAESIMMERKTAFAHFTLKFPDGVVMDENTTVSISGEGVYNTASVSMSNGVRFSAEGDGTLTVGNGADFYVTILPGEESITPTFRATAGGKEYTGTLAERLWRAGEFVRESHGNGVAVLMETEDDPVVDPTDEDVAGPVFEIDGEKFRFTKGNLAFRLTDRTWYIQENSLTYLCKRGWTDFNGNWKSGQTAPEAIDLFGWGCTGEHFTGQGYAGGKLVDFDLDLNRPEYWARTPNGTVNNTQETKYYPSQNEDLNSANTGALLAGGFKHMPMDWGYAYGKQKYGDTESFYTLSSEDWTKLLNNYVMVAATVTDAKNLQGKTPVYGCLILNVRKNDYATPALWAAAAKEFLNSKVTTVSSVSTNLGFTGTSYTAFDASKVKMTVEQLEKMIADGDAAFLAQAGRSTPVSVGYTYNEGDYWTSTPSGTNGAPFTFDGSTTPKKFNLTGINRMFGYSVRLVKKVD